MDTTGAPTGEGLKVLLVQGNPSERRETAQRLAEAGCEVVAVGGAGAALAATEEMTFGLAVVDCQLTGPRGFELAELLRDAVGPGLRVVGLSSGLVSACHDRACGMDAILAKPPGGEAIAQVLASLPPAGAPRGEAAPCGSCPNGVPRQALSRIEGMEPEFVEQLLAVFETDTAARLARIEQALADGELCLAQREVHALKSGCMQVGAEGMTRCCDMLAASLQHQTIDLARAELMRLRQAFRDACGPHDDEAS